MIKIEPIDICDKEIQLSIEALMEFHFEEVYHEKATLRLSPNWELFEKYKELNMLIAYGAFYNDVLVGYIGLVVVPQPHYRGSFVAVSDTIFLHKDFRDGSAGIRLMNTARDKAKEVGAMEVHWAAKPDSQLDALLKRRKNTKIRDYIYREVL